MPLVAIVDDDEAVRDTVEQLLDSAGFSTATFASAESLLQSALLRTVACVVTDLCMPGMNGLELHQRLMASLRPIPAILVTGCTDERMRERALQAGLAGYLAKPFHASELLACIRSAMHQWQPLPAAAQDDALGIEED
jgi:FixJ family two-component response regulator